MNYVSELAVFAARYGVSPSEAHVLPALFERTAQVMGWQVRAFIAEATYRNQKLGEYLAQCATKVALECPR